MIIIITIMLLIMYTVIRNFQLKIIINNILWYYMEFWKFLPNIQDLTITETKIA